MTRNKETKRTYMIWIFIKDLVNLELRNPYAYLHTLYIYSK